MATNVIFPGVYTRTLPVVASVVSGEVVKVGSLVGLAITTRDSAGNATVEVGPAVTVTAAAAAYTAGDAIYGHKADGSAITGRVELIDKTSTTGTLIGYALETKTLAAEGALKIQLAIL
jgi:predicted RecA/RadA family phage recombinase